jgi:hypothetical protein
MDYTTLIPSMNRQKPHFAAVVDLLCNAVGAITDTLVSMEALFDVDTAGGEQLDFIGLWVGCSRRLSIPLSIFFSWDVETLGWDQAQWLGQNQSETTVILLDDENYRNLIKTTIRMNHWDGSLVQYQAIIAAAFPANSVWAVDNQDMTMALYVSGPPLSAIQRALLEGGPLSEFRPAGVKLNIADELFFGFEEAGPSAVGFNQGIFSS